ncbi:MAG: hypothetical protein AB1480_13255 [Nitrospirota bacterium]
MLITRRRTGSNSSRFIFHHIKLPNVSVENRELMKFYAHSIEGKPVDEWHRLEEHLKDTAELAASFAAEFGCQEWGYLADVTL